MFSDEAEVLRQVCNGIMCVGAIMVIDTFARYIWRRYQRDRGWLRDITVLAAATLIVLFVGHAIRAFSAWMQFLYLSLEWNPSFWTNSALLYIPATIFIIIGKMLAIYFFSPQKTRVMTTTLKVGFMIAIPVVLAIMVELA